MPTIQFEPDPIAMAVMEATLSRMPDQMATAGRDALNRTMEHGRTVSSTDVAASSGATKGSVLKRIGISKATKKKLEAALYIRGGKGINLAGFGARQTKQGVTAKVFGTSRLYPGAFKAPGLNKNTIVAGRNKFVDKAPPTKGRYAGRVLKRGPRTGQLMTRQKIDAKYGPTAAESFANTPGVAEHTTAELNSGFTKNIKQQTDRFLNV